MKKFSYSKICNCSFSGKLFYEKYKEAEFLKDERNVQNILSKQAELDHYMTVLKPGEFFEIEGMFLKPGCPLSITKSGCVDERDVDNKDFTPRRLSGLTAAYVLDHSSMFPNIYVTEAENLDLAWNVNDKLKQLIYLSAVSGAEYFTNHFGFCPIFCGTKKYLLKQISAEMLIDMTNIRYNSGTRVSMSLKNIWVNRFSYDKEKRDKLTLGGTFDLIDEAIQTLPEEIRCLFESPAASEISLKSKPF